MYTRELFLQNGIRVVSSHLPDSHSTTLCLIIAAGSSHEHIPGLAHFVEHMVFKGTKKRPEASIINNEVESVGGYFNAATSQEFTEYYIKIPSVFTRKAFDILSDIVAHSLFDPVEMEKEKDVVGEEIHMYEDMPIRSVSDTFYSLVWQHDPLGRSILGTVESVKSLTRNDILSFTGRHYTPENMIISIAGNLDGVEVEALAEEYFGGMTNMDIPYAPDTHGGDMHNIQKGRNISYHEDENHIVRVENKKVRQAHLCLGFTSLPYTDRSIYPLQLANGVLAEGSGSYLWQKIREEMGASYYLNGEIDAFATDGLWYFHAGVDEDKLEPVLQTLLTGYRKILEKEITEAELVRAKEYLKGDFLMNLEGSEEIARYNGHELREHKRITTPQEELALIDGVDVEGMHDVVKKVTTGKLYVNILTKQTDLNTLKEILEQ